jgi:alcohol dehydrogenase class IV
MNFEFATASRIIFGPGTVRQTGTLAAGFGKQALVVGGASGERAARLSELLAESGIFVTQLAVNGEPTVDVVREGTMIAVSQRCELVIGIGGGSALDAGKAISALATNPGDIYQYLEVIGQGKPLTAPPLPFIAIPTTAGTGTEVTRNAVIGSPQHSVKVSIRHPLMLPKIALIDPELTYSLPPQVTATSGMDALTQLIEPFTCNQPNPIVDALCRDGIVRSSRSLRKAFEHGEDHESRIDLSYTSMLGGVALANARLGGAHGFAGPIGGMASAPHGAICARLLPLVMEFNIRALEERAPGSEALGRYQQLARLLTGVEDSSALDGVRWVYELRETLHIPPLREYGISEQDIDLLVEKSTHSSSMKGNPVKLTSHEMSEILRRAL